MKKLTPKQQKFADNYIETGNATKSAIDAGYAPKAAYQTGAENLKKPQVKSYIDERMEKLSKSHIMSAQEAMELLTRIATGEEKETVFISGIDGVEQHSREPDPKTKISAVKEILKRYPGNDKLVEQQVRKLTAEADVAEAKAKAISEADNSKDSTLIVDNVEGRND